MRAYKCDVCGKYCEDCYEIKDDTFDVFPSDFIDRGYHDKKKVEVRDLCSECYVDIKNYIHNKVFNRFKKEEESK